MYSHCTAQLCLLNMCIISHIMTGIMGTILLMLLVVLVGGCCIFIEKTPITISINQLVIRKVVFLVMNVQINIVDYNLFSIAKYHFCTHFWEKYSLLY